MSGVGWMKTGANSTKLAQQQAAEAEVQKAERGKMFRFFIKEGEEAKITFLDGELSPQGFLTPPRYYEHMVYFNNSWRNFVCPEKTSPELGMKCPLCESGDRASLVALFTVIDHRSYTSTQGKQYKDTVRLLVAKPQTFEMLNKLAVKRDGLTGCTFDVNRVGDKAAAVGNMYDFSEKRPLAELQKLYTVEKIDEKKNKVVSPVAAADYEQEISFHTEDELRKLGLGGPQVAGAAPKVNLPAAKAEPAPDATQFEEHL